MRYTCQIALPGFGEAGQAKLRQARVLVVGAGGLGCPAAQYLAAAGVGYIGIADFDTVSISNLHRQILYTPAEVGQPKATLAAVKLMQQNPDIEVLDLTTKIDTDNVMDILAGYDLLIDCTDNFETRYLLNDAAVLTGKPIVYGAIYQYEGQVAIWNAPNADGSRSPHYRDVFPEVDPTAIPNCAEGGVLPALAGIIGCMQANEALKWIAGVGETLAGKLYLFDALTMQGRTVKLARVSRTPVRSLPRPVEATPVIEAAELRANPERYQLIDVRGAAERAAFHIGGALIPLPELETALPDLSFDRPVVFYCASGVRSAQAVRLFQTKWPEKEVYSLEGGLKRY